jgi:hypothetical protein
MITAELTAAIQRYEDERAHTEARLADQRAHYDGRLTELREELHQAHQQNRPRPPITASSEPAQHHHRVGMSEIAYAAALLERRRDTARFEHRMSPSPGVLGQHSCRAGPPPADPGPALQATACPTPMTATPPGHPPRPSPACVWAGGNRAQPGPIKVTTHRGVRCVSWHRPRSRQERPRMGWPGRVRRCCVFSGVQR